MRPKCKLIPAASDRRKRGLSEKSADHHLSHAILWRIMEICSSPEVSKAVQSYAALSAAKERGDEG